ncbi:uncharacterized protein G2W53_006853 [Senna tora]|uniref:Uncharacterized protein n=1 Tax=Senna tora TaxID=362788 RepID=A0A834X4Y2_9FABA|nr:uncharacterized protein G2W53_006853 [Senna tora]
MCHVCVEYERVKRNGYSVFGNGRWVTLFLVHSDHHVSVGSMESAFHDLVKSRVHLSDQNELEKQNMGF